MRFWAEFKMAHKFVLLLVIGIIFWYQSIMALPAKTSERDQVITIFNSGKYAQALEGFKRLNQANPADELTHYYLALCYQKLNQLSLAKQEYQWVSSHATNPVLKANSLTGLYQLTPHQGLKAQKDGGAVDVINGTVKSQGLTSGGRPKIIEFSATWCGPCKKFAPVYEKVKANYQSRIDFQSVDIDDTTYADLVNKYSVRGVPMVVFLNAEGKLVDSQVGLMNEASFVQRVQQLLGR